MPKEKKSGAAKHRADAASLQCVFHGAAAQCLLLGERSFDTGGVELAGGEVKAPRGLCGWHVHCRIARIGGRYRSDFEAFVDEQRAAEKRFVDGAGARPTHWVRHDAADLWEACNGIRELPRVPARMREHWTDPEPELSRRRIPPAIVRWFVGLCRTDVLEGKVGVDQALAWLREKCNAHEAATADEVFE